MRPPNTDAGRIRAAHGLARYRIASRAGTRDAVVRIYELDRDAVSADVRARLDRVYGELLAEFRERVAALPRPPWPYQAGLKLL